MEKCCSEEEKKLIAKEAKEKLLKIKKEDEESIKLYNSFKEERELNNDRQ